MVGGYLGWEIAFRACSESAGPIAGMRDRTVAWAFEAAHGHMPGYVLSVSGGRSGCLCCSAAHRLASASLLKPEYLPGRVPTSVTYTLNVPSASRMIR